MAYKKAAKKKKVTAEEQAIIDEATNSMKAIYKAIYKATETQDTWSQQEFYSSVSQQVRSGKTMSVAQARVLLKIASELA